MTGSETKLVRILKAIDIGENLTSVDLTECNLSSIPDQLYQLADSLEFLNLGNNLLDDLPIEFSAFQKLRILFIPNNSFKHIPTVLGSLKSLYMLSLKSNQISIVTEDCLSPSIGWLILTGNRINKLPDSIGMLSQLRKLMLAGNCLSSLPNSLANCPELELIRIAANNFTEFPPILYDLPKLSWLAFGGNPCSTPPATSEGLSYHSCMCIYTFIVLSSYLHMLIQAIHQYPGIH